MTGLAIAQAYAAAFDRLSVVFIGSADGFETRLVPAHGYELATIRAAPLMGTGPLGKLLALGSPLVGAWQARRILRDHGTRLVIGVGGFASVGGILAARSLGLRSVIHDANALPGRTNRYLSHLVDRVFVGWAPARELLSGKAAIVTGNPVRTAIAQAAAGHHPTACLGDRLRVFIAGGSAGSGFLNEHIPEMLARAAGLGLSIEVTHQCGDFEPEIIRRAYAQAGIDARVEPYFERIEDIYRRTHLAVCCAGAMTLAELAVFSLPCVLVPLRSAADDHQAVNARIFAEATGCRWIREQDWQSAEVAAWIAALWRDPEAWRALSGRVRSYTRTDAAAAIVAECESMMAGAW